MYVNATIFRGVNVNTFDIIKGLCEEAGLLTRDGLARVEDGKIVVYWLDSFDKTQKTVIYDKPFDVKYAATLISLYEQTKEFLSLYEKEKKEIEYNNAFNTDSDYKTAYRLELKR